ncbi:MAG: hypothetical protein JWP74_640 [Marmoricola sp.]|nr:hypothetical protein [Marmoricola sp.]
MRSSRRARFVGTGVLVAALAATGLAVAAPSSADETTIGYSPLRTSWDSDEAGLISSSVTQPDFGQLWSTTVDGTTASTPNQMYAQPLVIGHLVIVVTEENTVEALNTATGKKVWTDPHLGGGTPWTPFAGCGDLLPHIGMTATPVYDPATNLIYLVAKYQAANGAAVMKMHAISPTTGKETAGSWPLTLSGKSTNSNEPFNPTTANARPALLLLNGGIYFATASHCDKGPYVGFVGHVTTGAKPSLKLWSTESGAATNEAGIWQSGGGPMSDGDGRIFVATGNGVSPTPAKGTSPPSTLGESVVRLGVNSDGSMAAKDFFSPANNAALDQDDADLGSGGPVALPDSFGSTADPHLLVVAGKEGTIYLLNRSNLGGDAQGPHGTDDVVSSTTGNGVWGRAAAFDGGSGNHYLYVLPSHSSLQAIKVAPNTDGVPTMSVAATSAESFGYTSGTPIVTSDGGNAATALVWVVGVDDSTGANGRLEAYPAIPPTTGAWKPVVTFPLGAMPKFAQPASDDGHVYVGTRDGRVLAFGSPTTGAITASPFTFPDQPVGASEQGTVTLTANDDATITGITASPGSTFTAGTPSPATGTALDEGATVTVPVTFNAQTPGTSSGTLSVTATTAAGSITFPFSLSGTGTQEGVIATPTSLAFGNIALGQGKQLGVTIQNTGTTAETITSVSPLAKPFSLTSSLSLPYVLPALGSVTLTARYSPSAATASTGQLQVTTDAATHNVATIPLSGTGFTGAPRLTYAPTSIDFRYVPPGTTSTRTFTLTNTGTSTMTINKAAVPSSPFLVASPIDEGQHVEPGDDLTITVVAKPLTAEPFTDHYSVTVNDGKGPHLITFKVNTAGPSGQLASPLGCVTDYRRLRVNGTAIVNEPCDGSEAQKFRRTPSGGLQLTNGGDGTYCLDIPKGSRKPGTPVQLYTCNKSAAQQFVPDSSNRLVNPRSKLCLNIRKGSTQPGARLVVSRCGVSASEQWDPGPLLAARGELSSGIGPAGQFCMSDPKDSTRQGTALELAPCTVSAGQLITHVGNTLRVGGHCLTMAQPKKGSAVRLQQCSGSSIQVFTSIKNGRLYNPRTKLCIDDPKGSRATGTKLQGYTCNGSAPQRWGRPR